jgi:hypothetical protein
MCKQFFSTLILVLVMVSAVKSQPVYELNTGWKCRKASLVRDDGPAISSTGYDIGKWEQATVPGTVLATMLNNKEIPDPFYGMNNEKIPDIYNTGGAYYTYWFVKDFEENLTSTQQAYIKFSGVNYSCNIFLNGHQLNKYYIRECF